MTAPLPTLLELVLSIGTLVVVGLTIVIGFWQTEIAELMRSLSVRWHYFWHGDEIDERDEERGGL